MPKLTKIAEIRNALQVIQKNTETLMKVLLENPYNNIGDEVVNRLLTTIRQAEIVDKLLPKEQPK